MPDENVTQQTTPTEPAQVPVSTPVVEIPTTEPTSTQIPPAEPIPAPVAEPLPVIEPVLVPEPTQPVATESVKTPEEPIEIEMPEPVEQSTPATQPQTVSTPVEPKTEPKPAEPQVVEKIVYKEDSGIIRRLLDKAKSKIQERKRKKLDKIMSLFTISPQISSKDVQKLLRTSKRTATRYLDQLEQEQKITQHGKIGHGVLYTKKP